MKDRKSTGMDQLDFRLILAFTNAYSRLYKEGLLTQEQLEKILILLDNYQNYTAEDFEKKLKEIFPDIPE